MATVNGIDGKKVQGFLDRIFALDDDVEAIKEQAKNEADEPKEDIKEIVTEVEQAGIDPKAFRVFLRLARKRRKLEKEIAAVDGDLSVVVESLTLAVEWDKTPLGAAAAAANDHTEAEAA